MFKVGDRVRNKELNKLATIIKENDIYEDRIIIKYDNEGMSYSIHKSSLELIKEATNNE
jgi:hypothetical protein